MPALFHFEETRKEFKDEIRKVKNVCNTKGAYQSFKALYFPKLTLFANICFSIKIIFPHFYKFQNFADPFQIIFSVKHSASDMVYHTFISNPPQHWPPQLVFNNGSFALRHCLITILIT